MIEYSQDGDGIAHIVWNNPDGPVNVKSAAAMEAFARAVDRALADDAVKGVLVRSAKRDFVAGGDLAALHAVTTTDEARALVRDIGACLRRMERSGKPFVAVLEGSALGGGLEVALACHHRVAVDDPRLGLGAPETTLGLVPGAGGTQRLPRLVGIAAAVSMMVGGTPIGVREALARGLIDAVVPAGQAVEAARRLALANPVARQPWDRTPFRCPGFQPGSPEAEAFFATAAAEARRRSPAAGPAAATVLGLVERGMALDLDGGLALEAEAFARITVSPSAKNRIRVQFVAPGAVRRAVRSAQGDAAPPARLGVVGAGTMGSGIALAGARAGMPTVLVDRHEDALEQGIARIARTLDTAVARGSMTAAERDATLARVEPTTDIGRLAGSDVVVEAVVEVEAVKVDVFRAVLDAAGPEVVLASNTSTLSITRMAAQLGRPDRLVGLHFFAPVDRMALVEVIVGRETAAATLARAHALLAAMRKTPVVVGDGPGFYTSRVVAAYTREALHMLAEGVPPEAIDRAALTAGFAIGPLAMADLTSYDLLKDILTSLSLEGRGTAADSQRALRVVDRLLAAGRVGRKGAGGVYDHGPEGRRAWAGLSALFPSMADPPSDADLAERLLDVQSIETAHAIAEGIARDPLALDLAAVLGWSYPAARGGVLAHVDDAGIAAFVRRCDERSRTLGPRYAVPELLRRMAADGARFHAPARVGAA